MSRHRLPRRSVPVLTLLEDRSVPAGFTPPTRMADSGTGTSSPRSTLVSFAQSSTTAAVAIFVAKWIPSAKEQAAWAMILVNAVVITSFFDRHPRVRTFLLVLLSYVFYFAIVMTLTAFAVGVLVGLRH